jgi:AcrR family transcriptional regulator
VQIDSARGVAALPHLRNEPIQARSAARLSALLDAAAAAVDEVGVDRLTTALVAERSGASIGTVYRYFPDRVAVLDGLSHRVLERLVARLEAAGREPSTGSEGDPVEARVSQLVDALVDSHRNEPGHRALRLGAAAETVRHGDETAEDAVVRAFGRGLSAAGIDDPPFRLRVALASCEVLVHRAFLDSVEGDPRLIAEAKVLAARYLAQHSGSVS